MCGWRYTVSTGKPFLFHDSVLSYHIAKAAMNKVHIRLRTCVKTLNVVESHGDADTYRLRQVVGIGRNSRVCSSLHFVDQLRIAPFALFCGICSRHVILCRVTLRIKQAHFQHQTPPLQTHTPGKRYIIICHCRCRSFFASQSY